MKHKHNLKTTETNIKNKQTQYKQTVTHIKTNMHTNRKR